MQQSEKNNTNVLGTPWDFLEMPGTSWESLLGVPGTYPGTSWEFLRLWESLELAGNPEIGVICLRNSPLRRGLLAF